MNNGFHKLPLCGISSRVGKRSIIEPDHGDTIVPIAGVGCKANMPPKFECQQHRPIDVKNTKIVIFVWAPQVSRSVVMEALYYNISIHFYLSSQKQNMCQKFRSLVVQLFHKSFKG